MNDNFDDMSRNYPNNIAMEKFLLSTMLFKEGAAVPRIADIVSESDFYRPEHKIIFRTLMNIYNKNQPPNLLSLIESLKQSGELERITLQYLYALSDIAHTDAYVETYAKEIKEKARLREFIQQGQAVLEKARSATVAVDELRTEFENLLFKPEENKSADFSTESEISVDVYQRATELSKTKGLTGVTTGFIDLNKVTNGLKKSDLILLAARPSMGKTALALNIAQNAAKAGNVVAMFSLEMSKAQLGTRLLSSLSGVDSNKIQSGRIDDDDKRRMLAALERMDKIPLYVDDTSGLTVAAMRSKARRLKQTKGLDFIVVDYLQLMQGKGENRVQEISGISRGLKALAKEFDVPVLALSQLSRNVEMRAEKKPQLSDLRDSGSLEQDADIVMFLYRDEYYNRDEDANKNLAELNIAKNRNGATTSITLYFKKELTKFGDFVRTIS